MPYDNDEAKRAARARLEQRMSRRGSSAGAHAGGTGAPTRAYPVQSRRLPLIIAAIAAVAVMAVIMLTASRCSANGQVADGEAGTAQATQSTAGNDGAADDGRSGEDGGQAFAGEAGEATLDEDVEEELVNLIGEDEAKKLLDAASADADAFWIASHIDEYGIDGEAVQAKILKLAADEPTALPYVRSFPSQYPLDAAVDDASIAMQEGSPSPDVPETNVPHFYQWDRRWGNTVYSSAAFGLTGCGPTSYAMAYKGITGKTDIDPYEMGRIAEERGYMSEFNGTANAFFGDMAEELGMSYDELYPSAENLLEALSSGHVVIAHLGPGLFTAQGHFFVLAGVAENGEVILNDPYSLERSSRTWPAETIAEEATVYYSLAALGA